MMKIDSQRAVQLRIPNMVRDTDRHFRPTVFICDEYQNFATVGGDSPVGWLSGRTSSNKGSVAASKHYQKSKEPLFEERAFLELKNAQATVVAFDGIHRLPATYCYLKLDFLPTQMTRFEQERINFDPNLVHGAS